MKQYFSLLHDVLTEHELQSKPSQIYNVDESGVPFDARPPNVVATKGAKKVRYRSSGRKRQVTIGLSTISRNMRGISFNKSTSYPEYTTGGCKVWRRWDRYGFSGPSKLYFSSNLAKQPKGKV